MFRQVREILQERGCMKINPSLNFFLTEKHGATSFRGDEGSAA